MQTKLKILRLKSDGLSYNEIAKAVPCAKSTVQYYLNGFGNEHVRQRMAISRNKNRKNAIDVLRLEAGGRCNKCGYNRCLKVLHFHHIESESKTGSISNLLHRNGLAIARAETKKCALLCANCHGELHVGLWSVSDLILPGAYS